jgi:hypothetical protein
MLTLSGVIAMRFSQASSSRWASARYSISCLVVLNACCAYDPAGESIAGSVMGSG